MAVPEFIVCWSL